MKNIGLKLNLTALAIYIILIALGATWYHVFPFTFTAQIIGIILQSKGY